MQNKYYLSWRKYGDVLVIIIFESNSFVCLWLSLGFGWRRWQPRYYRAMSCWVFLLPCPKTIRWTGGCAQDINSHHKRRRNIRRWYWKLATSISDWMLSIDSRHNKKNKAYMRIFFNNTSTLLESRVHLPDQLLIVCDNVDRPDLPQVSQFCGILKCYRLRQHVVHRTHTNDHILTVT